jgi:hypothetical protein
MAHASAAINIGRQIGMLSATFLAPFLIPMLFVVTAQNLRRER